jgi:hypothetical protein
LQKKSHQVYRAKLIERDDGVLDVAIKVIHPKVQVCSLLRSSRRAESELERVRVSKVSCRPAYFSFLPPS